MPAPETAPGRQTACGSRAATTGESYHHPGQCMRPATDREITFTCFRYELTLWNFYNYSAGMEAELDSLEDKLKQFAALCQRLREENHQLRQQLAAAQHGNKQLEAKIADATKRLEDLLVQIPEDAA
jgi:cell division protein ZapB